VEIFKCNFAFSRKVHWQLRYLTQNKRKHKNGKKKLDINGESILNMITEVLARRLSAG